LSDAIHVRRVPSRNGTGTGLLADPTRCRIIAMCAGRMCGPSMVARQLGVAPSTATRQLRMLADAVCSFAARPASTAEA
jgi:hypothetical protein